MVEWDERWLGRRFKHVNREVLTLSERGEWSVETIRGRGKGGRGTVTFTGVPEVTRMDWTLEYKGVLVSILGSLLDGRLEREIDDVLDGFAEKD